MAVNTELQFSFRQQVEPVYRQFVELLLTDIDLLSESQKQERLEQSRIAIADLSTIFELKPR